MPTPESSLESLENRVAKLEAQNRRLKKVGIASLIVAVGVITMGQAKPNRTPRADSLKADTIEAQNILLRDERGEVAASLSAISGTANLIMGKQGDQVVINTGQYGPFIKIDGGTAGGDTVFYASSLLSEAKGGIMTTDIPPEGPWVRLIDHEGFETRIGSSSLETVKTGEKHQTSAASIVLFGKDKKVLWSAP